jgi:hypothetical protein
VVSLHFFFAIQSALFSRVIHHLQIVPPRHLRSHHADEPSIITLSTNNPPENYHRWLHTAAMAPARSSYGSQQLREQPRPFHRVVPSLPIAVHLLSVPCSPIPATAISISSFRAIQSPSPTTYTRRPSSIRALHCRR